MNLNTIKKSKFTLKYYRMIITFLLLAFFTIPGASGQETQSEIKTFNARHQTGIRMGVWNNQGDTPRDTFTVNDSFFKTTISDANFYFEGYYAWRLLPYALVEISAGIVNKGSVTIHTSIRDDIGNLMIYPILLHMRLYPMSSISEKLKPYVALGGGLYYARRTIELTTDIYSYPGYREKSATDFNIALGAGTDYLLGKSLALELSARYCPISLNKTMLDIQNYDAFTITIGFKYLYSGGRKTP